MTTAGGEPPIAPLRGVASAGSWRIWCCLPAKHPLTRATGRPTPDNPPSPHHCLSLLAGPRTPREPGSCRLSFLLLRTTPPRGPGFVNLILLRTSKKITIPQRRVGSSGPRERPRLPRVRRHLAAGGSTSAVTLGWNFVAACGNPAGSLEPLMESLPAGLRYTHRKQLKASFPGCAGFGRWGVPSALVWQPVGCEASPAAVVWKSCGLRGPCGSDGPAGHVRRPAGAPRPNSALATCRRRDKREGRAGDVAASARTPAGPLFGDLTQPHR